MNITEHLRQAASGSDTGGLDLDHLARVARSQGTRARRRRRGAAVLGCAALVGVVAGSAALLDQDPGRAGVTVAGSGTPSASPSAAPSTAPSTGPGGLVGLTGRGVAAGLIRAVGDVAQGSAGAFAGQGDGLGEDPEAYAQLDWVAADGLGVSVIGVNVQPGMGYVATCRGAELRCTSTVTDGSTLTTYEEHTPTPGGVGIRRTADLLRADGTRVVVSETNGRDLPANRWDVTRPQPPLSYAQLTRIVQRPWWGAELPGDLLEEGERLAPYDDLDGSSVTATPSSPPSSQ
jgi:hypothetical protein